MAERITLSVIKADVGGFVGHSVIHPALADSANEAMDKAKDGGMLVDAFVTHCGDDLELIMTHERGEDNAEIHKLAFDTFMDATKVAEELKLYGAGQDLISTAFSGNVKGMGPGVAEMEIEERPSEPVIVFMADKTSAGSWNFPFYKMFADPFNTAGLVIAEVMQAGFSFEIQDVKEHRRITLHAPEEIYPMLVFLGSPQRYAVKRVYARETNEIAAVSSTERLAEVAGRYVGKDDPVCIVRCQNQFPAVGEVLEPFSTVTLVEGWMRGSHRGPFMPVSFDMAHPARFDGPPRVIAAGFQLANGKLVGPRDMFDDPSFDRARADANVLADLLRRHGPFEPHRLPLDEMEYTTMPLVARRFEDRWGPLD